MRSWLHPGDHDDHRGRPESRVRLGRNRLSDKPIDWNRLTAVLRKHRRTGTDGLVLVVEDDADTRELIERNLERDGWSVALAANGRVALDALPARPPEIILLDLLMPRWTGSSSSMNCVADRSGTASRWWSSPAKN